MNKRVITWLAGICILTAAQAQTRQPDEMAFRVKDVAFNQSHIDSLSHFMTDKLGPRLAASKMKLRAEQMVADKLREYGFENVRIEKATDFAKGGWDNEKNYVAMTAPYYCSFAANPKAWSGSTNGLVKGECIVLDASEPADLAKYSGKLGGKIVLMAPTREYQLSFEPMAQRLTEKELEEALVDQRTISRPKRARMDFSKVRAFRAALDSMIKAEKPLAVVSGDGMFNIPGSRGVSYKSGDPEPVPEIALPIEDHGRMVRLINGGDKVEMELEIKNVFTDNPQINNVIAEIPGTDPKLKNEIVLLGGHLDSWHGGTGAEDNAAGCITMIEALRILKELGVKPRRTIRVALWGGEEQGLYGSRGYANNYLYDNADKKKLPGYDNFALYLNSDFGSGRYRGIYLEENDMAKPYFEAWMTPLESLGFTTLSPQSMGSTDHVTFNRLGLPAYQFLPDPLDYFRTYHSTMDTYERLISDDLKINSAIVAWLAYSAAMDNGRIPVKPGYPKTTGR